MIECVRKESFDLPKERIILRLTDCDEEYYGPWDGVLRDKYSAVYARLLRLLCLQGRATLYTAKDDVCRRKICQRCYLGLYDMQRASYEEAFNHLMTLQNHYRHQGVYQLQQLREHRLQHQARTSRTDYVASPTTHYSRGRVETRILPRRKCCA